MSENGNPVSGGTTVANAGGSTQANTAVASIVGTLKGFRGRLQQMLQGIETVVPDGSSLSTDSGLQTKVAIVAELTQVISAYKAVEAQQLAVVVARKQLKNASAADHRLYTQLKDALVAFFGRGNPLLVQFGINAKGSKRALTPEQKVLSAAKARATRAARHTMGARQKAAVKSDGKLSLSVQTEGASATKPAPVAGPTVPTP
jgi:hypothetical protein